MSTTIEQWERAEIFEHECFDDKKTQCEMIHEYLIRFGEITPLEALSAIGCYRLSARIADLRAKGINITTEINKGKKQYAIYKLEEEDNGSSEERSNRDQAS